MKRIALIILMCGLLGPLAAQEGGPRLRMTLEDCLDYAMGNSYGRQSAKLNEDLREVVYDQSKLERIPSLSANLTEGLTNYNDTDASWSGNYDLSASVTLFQGGQINNTIEQNRLQLEQTKMQTRQYDNDLTIQILQSFLTALGNEELLKYQQALMKASEEQVAQGRARYSAGDIIESDYLLLEAQYASDLNNITETTISLNNSLVALKGLMSMDLGQPLELIYPDTTAIDRMLVMPSEGEVLTRSMETLPDIQISNYNVEIAEAGLKISRSAYYPTLSASGSVGTGHRNNYKDYGTQLSDQFNQQAGLTLSIPIFNRNRTRSNVTQSKINLQQAELDRLQTQLNIEQTLISEYGSVVSAGSKYQAAEVSQNAYMRSFEAYTEMFRQGAITAVELLQQQNNYISAMNDYIQSKYSFMLRRKVLDVYMGIGIEDM